MKKLLALIPALTALSCASVGAEDKLMKPYPAPQAGYERVVISLPPQQDEYAYKVEVLPGQTMTVDCNRVSIPGDLVEKVAEGWGYTYYVLEKVGAPVSTKMMCPPDDKPRQAFVAVRGQGELIRYNSKLPLVVYVPKGFEVQYRIWQAGDTRTDAVKR